MKVYYYFLVFAVCLTIGADLVGLDIIQVDSGEIQLALVLIAGIGWGFTTGFIPRRFRWIPLFVSASHFVFWFVTSSLDKRTFFGGAMLPILSAFGWVLVTVIILAITPFRLRRIPKARDKSLSEIGQPRQGG